MSLINWKLENVLDRSIISIDQCTFTIGRSLEANLRSTCHLISKRHATLSRLYNGDLSVVDHESMNGTFINDVKVTPKLPTNLNHGDIIMFGVTPSFVKSPTFKGPSFIFKIIKSETTPLLPAVPEEPTTSASTAVPPKKDTEYSFSNNHNDDNCIVISDGEDDDLSCSQIFRISERIKQEPNSLEDCFDPYQEIKEELADLDYCNVNHGPIDLTDELDHFESTSQLLDVLECRGLEIPDKVPDLRAPLVKIPECMRPPNKVTELRVTLCRIPKYVIEKKRNTEKKEVTKDQSQNSINLKLKCETTHTSTKNLLDALEDSGDDMKETAGVATNISKEQPALELRISLSKSPKYIKPPIVEPHTVIMTSKKQKKEPVPKRVSETKPSEEIKRRKRSDSTDLKGDSTDLKERRKKRLKELASKSSTSKKPVEMQEKPSMSNAALNEETEISIKPAVKLRFSNIEQNVSSDQPSTSHAPDRKTSTNKDHKMTDPRIAKNKQSDPRVAAKKSKMIQDGTVTSNESPSSSLEWLGPFDNTMKSSKTVPDSTVAEDKSGMLWKISDQQRHRNLQHAGGSSSSSIDVMEEISHILSWNVGWLLEQKHLDRSPPVNFNQTNSRVPLVFNDYMQYSNVMLPLLNLELWQYIFQMTFEKEEERVPLKVNLEHERRAGRIMYLDCEYSTPAQSNHATPFRVEDFCLLELKVKDSQNHYQYTCFGYIKSVASNRQNTGVKFTVITKCFDKAIYRNGFFIKICANIAANLRFIKTIKYLEKSSLSAYVLNPVNLTKLMPIKTLNARKTPRLNQIQKEISGQASEMVLRPAPGFYLIKGPPGTGKSSVIVSIVLEILYKCKSSGIQPRILLTAPSNAAIDGLILKLYQSRSELPEPDRKIVKIVRIGPDSSINELVNRFTLKFQAKKAMVYGKNFHQLPEYRQVKDNHQDPEDFLKRMLGNQYSYEYRSTEDMVLMGANVICTTLNSCISYSLNQPARKSRMKYTCCIIDEATQCNEIECLSPIQLGIDKFILVGDPQQLSAVVCNKEAQQLGFGNSLFSRVSQNLLQRGRLDFPMKMLVEQYRMKPEICEYPNRVFYEGKLISSPVCYNPIQPPLKPYMVFNLTRTESENVRDYTNYDEVLIIGKLLKTLKLYVKQTCEFSIGIITPYRAQKEMITKHIAGIKVDNKAKIIVNTVDSFQGMENDIIIISCVRYSTNCFLANEQRLNVALTRARQALYIIGNYNLFKECRPLYDLREDAKRRKVLFDIKDNPRNIATLQNFIFS